MEVPCPVPLSEPWSPVGYQVVQVGDDKVPSSEQPPRVTLAASAAQPVPKLTTPRSPVGYKVVMVADETVPVTRREAPRRDFPNIWLPQRRPPRSSLAPLMTLGAIGVVILVPMFALAAMISSARQRAQMPPPMAVVIPDEIAVVPDEIREKAVDIKPAAPPAAVEPVAARPVRAVEGAAPVEEKPLPALKLPAGANCPECVEAKIPGAVRDREAFATAVEFVRNPQEAARVAKKEDKLTFLLHLSGNFEDPGFT